MRDAAAAPQSDAPVGAAKPEDDKEESDSSYSVPITVTGRAVDLAGKPVTAAEIFLASPRTNGEPLAKTKTDADGAYRFDKVPLPIKRADTNRGEDVGSFEVFGRAEGFGFTWRPHKWFYPNSAHVDGIGRDPTWDLPYRYGSEDPIELDLQFGPPAMLQGRVVNDLGEPLAAARLAIRRGQPLDDERSLRNLESFNWPELVPRKLKFQVTDDQGRFTFANLPEDRKFWIDVRPEGHSPRSVWAATSGGAGGDARGERIYSGDIELVFPRPRVVKMRVLYGDTGKPAAKVGVGGTVDVAGFWETTDDDGFAEASLPDGRYSISVFPRYGTPYLRTQFEVVVSVDSVKEPATVKLRPAAVVEITVVDSDTREPLPGTDVWLSDDPTDPSRRQIHGYRSWEVETRISHYEAPRSDKNGKMRVLVEPGERLIGVGLEAYPKGYEPVNPDGKRIDCRAGEPMAVEFQMKKKKPVAVQQPQAPPPKQSPIAAPILPRDEFFPRRLAAEHSTRAASRWRGLRSISSCASAGRRSCWAKRSPGPTADLYFATHHCKRPRSKATPGRPHGSASPGMRQVEPLPGEESSMCTSIRAKPCAPGWGAGRDLTRV